MKVNELEEKKKKAISEEMFEEAIKFRDDIEKNKGALLTHGQINYFLLEKDRREKQDGLFTCCFKLIDSLKKRENFVNKIKIKFYEYYFKLFFFE